MGRIWTHGVWTVKSGREDEFIEAWRAMARSAVAEFHPAESPHLLREQERPNVFRSFGWWEDEETVQRFRAHIGPHLETIRALTDKVEFFGLDEVPLDG
jgi:heme-degrading monooxygenase HmoA